jgi:hypothetical protein
MLDVRSGSVVDFEIMPKANASERCNYWGRSGEIEVGALRRIVKRWEDDQQVAVALTDQESKIAKEIRESRGNARHGYDANHAKKARPPLSATSKGRATASVQTRDGFNHARRRPIPVTRRLKCRRTSSITIAATTPSVTIQYIRAINGTTGTCLKRVCDGIWLKDQKAFKNLAHSAGQQRQASLSMP